jgi:hypothetical protein
MSLRKCICVIACFWILGISPLHAGWSLLQSDRFSVYYKKGDEFQARQALKSLEGYRTNAEHLTGFQIRKRIPVIIEDTGVIVNGMTDPVYEKIFLYSHQPRSDFGMIQNWWVDVGIHEYVHMLHMTGTTGFPYYFRKVFGTVYSPNLVSPPWVVEGITVYSESKLSPFSGRLNDGYYRALLVARAKEGKFPSLATATYAPIEIPLDAIYAYGGEFHRYLSEHYSPDRIPQLYRRTGGDFGNMLWNPLFPFWGVDSDFSAIYGKRTPAIWKDWENSLKEYARDKEWDGTRLTDDLWFKEHLVTDGRFLYYRYTEFVKTGPFRVQSQVSIVRYDSESGKRKVELRLMGGPSLDMKIKDGILYFSGVEWKEGFRNISYGGRGQVAKLFAYDLRTKKRKELLRGELTAYGIMENGNILYASARKDSLGADVYMLDRSTRQSRMLYSVEYYPESFFADQGKVIVNAKFEGRNYSIYEMNLEDGSLAPLVDTPWLEFANAFRNGIVYFSANYGNVYSGYSYAMQSSKVSRLTHSFYGVNPVEAEGKIYYLGLHSTGQELYRTASTASEMDLPAETEAPLVRDFTGKDWQSSSAFLPSLYSLWPKYVFPDVALDGSKILFGVGVAGKHVLDLISYQGVYYPAMGCHGGGEASVGISLPFGTGLKIDYSSLYSPAMYSGSLQVPVWSRAGPGLTSVLVSAGGYYYDQIQLAETSLAARAQFSFPLSDFLLQYRHGDLLREDALFPLGNFGSLRFEQMMGKFRFSSEVVYGKYSEWEIRIDERFHTTVKKVDAVELLAASVALKRLLVGINWGLWNPNLLYLEGLFGSVYADAEGTVSDMNGVKVGIKLELEHKFLLVGKLTHSLKAYFDSSRCKWDYRYSLENNMDF